MCPVPPPRELATGKLAEELFDRQQPLQVDQLQQTKLQVETLLLPEAKFIEGAQHDLQESRRALLR